MQPSAQVALLGDRLFGMHLNDGPRLGAEDGLMVGSVHPTMTLEMMCAGAGAWQVKCRGYRVEIEGCSQPGPL